MGVHEDSGTKRPYRLIRDIKEIGVVEGGFKLRFPDKEITYLVEEKKKEKILAKL